MHVEALTNEGRQLFPHLAQFKTFYLVGGTALALQIGHRLSVDFDMFSFDPLSEHLLQKIKRVFVGSPLELTYRAVNQINLIISGVKVTFFHFPYPVIKPFVIYDKVALASIEEIAAMKAFALGQRASYKDYVDWYFMLSEGLINLGEVIAVAKEKFGGEFNDRLLLGQLLSREDVTVQKIDFLRGEVTPTDIDRVLGEEVKKYAKDIAIHWPLS